MAEKKITPMRSSEQFFAAIRLIWGNVAMLIPVLFADLLQNMVRFLFENVSAVDLTQIMNDLATQLPDSSNITTNDLIQAVMQLPPVLLFFVMGMMMLSVMFRLLYMPIVGGFTVFAHFGGRVSWRYVKEKWLFHFQKHFRRAVQAFLFGAGVQTLFFALLFLGSLIAVRVGGNAAMDMVFAFVLILWITFYIIYNAAIGFLFPALLLLDKNASFWHEVKMTLRIVKAYFWKVIGLWLHYLGFYLGFLFAALSFGALIPGIGAAVMSVFAGFLVLLKLDVYLLAGLERRLMLTMEHVDADDDAG